MPALHRPAQAMRCRAVDWRLRLRRCVCSVRGCVTRKRSISATTRSGSSIQADVPRACNPNEAKVRITRDDGLGVPQRSEGFAIGPDQERGRGQRLPALAEDQLASIAESSGIGDARDQADHVLDVPSRVRDVNVEQ